MIPYRSPEFKVHKKEGLAHNALSQRGYTEPKAKYEFISGQWKRVWAYVPPTNCRRCGQSYEDVQSRQKAAGKYYGGKYRHDPSYDGPNWCAEPVCAECVPQINAEIEQAEKDMEQRENHERYFLNN
jgi:hypothetical protein